MECPICGCGANAKDEGFNCPNCSHQWRGECGCPNCAEDKLEEFKAAIREAMDAIPTGANRHAYCEALLLLAAEL
jgi:hypothetical protein